MKYFGTDGFRGKANVELTAKHAFMVGLSLGAQLVNKNDKPFVFIGKDTRLSSSMLESAVAAGVSSAGVGVKLLGVVPTPLVSFVTEHTEAVGAIMISASHNPYYDNGIKIFNEHGEKTDEQTEQLIENVIDEIEIIPLASPDKIGVIEADNEDVVRYIEYLHGSVPVDLTGYKLVLDCANGASVTTAKKAFENTGCELIVMNDKPDGYNINTNCGSTHPQDLVRQVLNNKADMGFAFDVDADRCIGVNDKGELITGDETLYLYARYLKENNKLKNNLVVTTVMANLGLFKAFEKLEIETVSTAVGDKYVFEALNEKDAIIGGEQSGHIIFRDLANTGDGVLTALKLASVAKEMGKSLSELTSDLAIYPQTLKNIKVVDKHSALENNALSNKIEDVRQRLNNDGRILVRPSGTEPLIRVMVEAKTQEICDGLVDEVIQLIQELNL